MEKSDNNGQMAEPRPNSTEAPPTALTVDSTTSTLQAEPRSERRPRNLNFISKMVHSEHHRSDDGALKEVIIGFADGLTVPFALTAGLSSLGSAKLVIIGGLAELFSGAISMGLGGYLAGITDADHYKAEQAREYGEVRDDPEAEKQEIYDILGEYNVSREHAKPLIDALVADPDQWVRFMMKFELELKEPAVWRALLSAALLGVSYFVGGIIPMIPYFVMDNVTHALFVSIGITAVILVFFGYLKNLYTVRTQKSAIKGAIQTLLVGAAAAGASYGIVRAIDTKYGVHG